MEPARRRRSRRIWWALAAVVGTFIAVWIYDQLQPLDEDRPAIRVRNGSIYFESRDYPWKEDLLYPEWKPDQDDGEDVEVFDVSVTTSTPSVCGPMSGTQVFIYYDPTDAGDEGTHFRFHIRRRYWLGRKEPKLESRVTLTPSADNRTLVWNDTAARIVRVRVVGGPNGGDCAGLTGAIEVSINPE